MSSHTRLDILKAIKADPDKRTGICAEARKHITRSRDYAPLLNQLIERMKCWPENVERRHDYPVPHPTMSNEEAFRTVPDGPAMWDERTEYGAARHRLLDWLIAEEEKEDVQN